MRRIRRRAAVLCAFVAMSGSTSSSAAPVPTTGDQSWPVASFATTVIDTTRPTRCRARGVDEPRRSLYVRVAHPATGAGHPVLLFAHGMRGDPDLMEDELEGWARKGYVAVAPRFPLSGRFSAHGWDCGWNDITNLNADLRFVLDALERRTGGFGAIASGLADTENVGASGISSGGIAVFHFYNDCCADPRVKAVDTQLAAPMLVAEGWRWGSTPTPLLMVNEREDTLVPLAQARRGFDAATGPRHLVTLPGGKPHSWSLFRADTPPQVWELRERLFDFHLRSDADARSRLAHAFDDVPAAYTYEFSMPLLGGVDVARLAGADRIATALAASADVFGPGEAGAAVLARADGYADALAGVPLAGRERGPLLLTSRDRLDERVGAHLQRLLPAGRTVHLLGGTTALSEGVAAGVASLGFHVERHAGADRFETAVRIAGRLGDPPTVLLASGTGFSDALAAGPAAARLGAALLLTEGTRLPAATRRYLDAHPPLEMHAVGGPAAAAEPEASPVVGADRYETAVAVARRFFDTPSVAGVATGEDFPDALGAGSHLAARQSPLLLTPRAPLPGSVRQYLADVNAAYVYGGQLVVSESVRVAMNEAA